MIPATRCECGSLAIGALRRPDEPRGEPICAGCLERVARGDERTHGADSAIDDELVEVGRG